LADGEIHDAQQRIWQAVGEVAAMPEAAAADVPRDRSIPC